MLNPNIPTSRFVGVESTAFITLNMAQKYILYSNLVADTGDRLKKKVRREIVPAMLLYNSCKKIISLNSQPRGTAIV